MSVPAIPFAFDYGGTLIKLAFYLPENKSSDVSNFTNCFHRPQLGDALLDGYLCFEKFPSSRPEELIQFLRKFDLVPKHADGRPYNIYATGGGAHNPGFISNFERELNVKIHAVDELSSVIRGLNAMLEAQPESLLFTYNSALHKQEFVSPAESRHFPYLLVNCGSGVSIMRVDSPTSFQRVSGTSLGGGTFLGLCRGLTGIEAFDDLKALVKTGGNSTQVDLLVGDIYGGDYAAVGLPAEVIASSFGKMHADPKYKPEDVVRSMLKMVSNNISQLAYLNARLHNAHHVVFTGFFVRNNEPMWHTISFGFDFWSQKTTKAMFVTADGFLGAVGAFVQQFSAPLDGAGAAAAATAAVHG